MHLSTKTGILLINLGTPNSPSVKDVRRYLKEFLSDPLVIDIHHIARWLLLHLFILPFRPKTSAAAYQKIWQPQGSPLLTHSQKLAGDLQDLLGNRYEVVLGMRYGNPSIESAIRQLQQAGCDNLICLPLYPQYSLSATQSSIDKTKAVLNKVNYHPDIKFINSFYNDPGFIDAYCKQILAVAPQQSSHFVLFSYHGLPERHIEKVNCKHQSECQHATTCPNISLDNEDCYRAQCYATSFAIATQLQLKKEQYLVSFQSRLGKTPWIKPYTDLVLPELIQRGIKNITIVCPSFVADCLETLEEIGMRAREQWESLGGESFTLVPCLNAKPEWVDAVKHLICEQEAIIPIQPTVCDNTLETDYNQR